MHGTRETIYTPRLTDIVKTKAGIPKPCHRLENKVQTMNHAYGDTPASKTSHIPVVTTGNRKGTLAIPRVPLVALVGNSGSEMLAQACCSNPVPPRDALKSNNGHGLGVEEIALGITQAPAIGIWSADVVGFPHTMRKSARNGVVARALLLASELSSTRRALRLVPRAVAGPVRPGSLGAGSVWTGPLVSKLDTSSNAPFLLREELLIKEVPKHIQ